MSAWLLVLGLPWLGALGLSVVKLPRRARMMVNLTFSLGGFALTLVVWGLGQVGGLAALFGALSGFVGVMAALAVALVPVEGEGSSARRAGLHDALFQAMLGFSLLGLYTGNIGLIWLALTGETMAAAWGLSLPRTSAALKEAWDYLLLNSIALGLALFGTLLIYLAAQPALGSGLARLRFADLSAHAAGMNQAWLRLGFVLILFGYGGKMMLVKLSGRTATSLAGSTALLSALSTNVALLAILRFRHLLQGASSGPLADDILLAFALFALFLAAFMLIREANIKRFLDGTEVQHAAMSLFAFGLGGPLAIFGGLLHRLLYTLLASGVCLALAQVMNRSGVDFSSARFRDLSVSRQQAGWVLGGALFAFSGLPPSGLFASEFIIIRQAIAHDPWICLPLSIGLGVCAGPVLCRAGEILSAPVRAAKPQKGGRMVGLAAMPLALMLVLAFAMPGPCLHIMAEAARSLQ